MNIESLAISWVLLLAGWLAYLCSAIADAPIFGWAALVLFVGAAYGFFKTILEA